VSSQRLAGGFTILAIGMVVLSRPDLKLPGLYYDETLQAATAAAFVRGEAPLALPGARRIHLGEAWLPWMTQPYLGALKTYALIPALAVVGTDAVALRATTLAWGVAGLLLFSLWCRELADTRVALASAALLAFDPSFLFSVRQDWGPFALGFACRMGSALLLLGGWRRRSAAQLGAGGLLAGLAVYHKLDAAAFFGGCALALAVSVPGELWQGLRERRRGVAAALAGVILGTAPLLPVLPELLATLEGLSAGRRGLGAGTPSLRLDLWSAVLDGSYFYRLLQVGGRFDAVFSGGTAPRSLLPVLEAASVAVLATFLLRTALRRRSAPAAEKFALFALGIVGAGLFAMPGALLMHHVLNVYPLPHLVAGLTLERLGRGGGSWGRRGAVLVLVLLAAVASAVRVDLHTRALIRATGGKGYWSHALGRLAEELPPGARVVSVDWGFAAPLRFAHPHLAVEETTWRLVRTARGRLTLDGGPRHVYLVHDREAAVLPFGARLLAAARALPEGDVEIRAVRDGEGDIAFHALCFVRTHRLVHRRGRFEIQWRPGGEETARQRSPAHDGREEERPRSKDAAGMPAASWGACSRAP